MQREVFDVVIVGSGVAGGAAAQQFCDAGLRVLILEAGKAMKNRSADMGSIAGPSDQEVQARCYAFAKNTRPYFVNDASEAYSTPSDKPFSWIRVRAVGGKSLLWAGHCYRMGDLDFKAAEADGVGEAWPLTYEEIRPYYDKAECVLRVRSLHDGLSDAGELNGTTTGRAPAVQARLAEAFAVQGCTLISARVSHNGAEEVTGTPCLSCGQLAAECLRPVSSVDSTLDRAMKTGRLTLWTEFSVQRITTDSSGKATGVVGVRHLTGEHLEVAGRLIFLCASALESTRILLNSASPAFPGGLANSSGVLGHYLMDHVSGILLTAICDGDGAFRKENGRAEMFYLPRWQNLADSCRKPFLRGFGFQGFIMRADHELLPCGRTQRALGANQPVATDLNDAVLVRLAGFGEMLPHYDNYVEIDKTGKRDVYGIPVLRIHCQHRENEAAMACDMVASGLELLKSAGARIKDVQSVASEPGLAIHEAGTCRMGDDPQTSILNRFNQCHDIRNLFVTDASCFPSIGTQNPALTIMALTNRACEHAVALLKQGHI